MEPPPKRLRNLHSVQVDEEDPEYIRAKQKQQQKFKGRLESIFAKYESMHESMSDEIDMHENKVVVDRGHLRRLNRQVNRNEAMLLDTLGLRVGRVGPGDDNHNDGEEEDDPDESEDELAPTQQTRSTCKRKLHHSTAGPDVDLPHNDGEHSVVGQESAAASTTLRLDSHQTPQTPNPAANLLQLMQFPQTPAGQQAQSTFYTTLAQTINQAVQQAVAPLFQGILPNTPGVQLPLVQALPAPVTANVANDEITPAKDPKWFFPPLSANAQKSSPEVSKPEVGSTLASTSNAATRLSGVLVTPKQKIKCLPDTTIEIRESSLPANSVKRPIVEKSIPPLSYPESPITRTNGTSIATPRPWSPGEEIRKRQQRLQRRAAEFPFTEDDDIHISKRKELHGSTWAAIRNSRKKWRTWPLIVFEQRWQWYIRGKKLYLKGVHTTEDYMQPLHVDVDASEASGNHLPTPGASEHEETPKEVGGLTMELNCDTVPSSSHFDDDERDLLSLAGDAHEGEQFPIETVEEQIFYPSADDTVLPSIELEGCVHDDALGQHSTRDSTPVNRPSASHIKTNLLHTSPVIIRRRKPAPVQYEAVPDTEAEEEDENNISSQPMTSQPHKRPRSTSLDVIGDDDLAAPITPRIKREFSTPPPSSFLFSSPARTPKAFSSQSSESRPTSRVDRKAYLKRIKQSWTKKAGTPGPQSVSKRKSFNVLPLSRKRRRVEEESEDELAM